VCSAHSGSCSGGSKDFEEKLGRALGCLFRLVLFGELDLGLVEEIQKDAESLGIDFSKCDYFSEFLECIEKVERGDVVVPDYFSDFLRWLEERGEVGAFEFLAGLGNNDDGSMPEDYFTEFRKKLAEEVGRSGSPAHQTGVGTLHPNEGITGFPPGFPTLFNSLVGYVREVVSRELEQISKRIAEISSMLERFPKPEMAKYVVADPRDLFSEEELRVLTENERYKLVRAYKVLYLGYADQGFPNLLAVVESMLTRLLKMKTGQEAEHLFKAAEQLEEYYRKNKHRERRADLMLRNLSFFKTLNIYWREGGKHIDGLADQELSERQMLGLVDPIKDLIRELSEVEKRGEAEKPESWESEESGEESEAPES